MPMGTRGNTPLPDKDDAGKPVEAPAVKPVDDPNVPMSELSKEDRAIRIQRVRDMDAFRHEKR